MNNESVDSYLQKGCGRCDRYETPECKVHDWAELLGLLRELLLASGLSEDMKWGSPCYTLKGKNVVMIAARNEYCALSFLKGAILDDPQGVLKAPGPNSRFARYFPFTSADELRARRELAVALIAQAVENERAGKQVNPGPANEPIPAELQERVESDPTLAAAYEALTPGRRRSHILYVSGAKQSKTREARSERCAAKILAGKGWNER